MAGPGKPENLKPFKPGQSGNPSGRPKLPKELRDVKEFTTEEIRRIIAKYMRLPKDELAELMKSGAGKLPMFEAMICSILANAYKTGDFSRLDFCLNRSGHKMNDKAKVEIHNHGDAAKAAIVKKMDEAEILAILARS
jgi:hypothetical protein